MFASGVKVFDKCFCQLQTLDVQTLSMKLHSACALVPEGSVGVDKKWNSAKNHVSMQYNWHSHHDFGMTFIYHMITSDKG